MSSSPKPINAISWGILYFFFYINLVRVRAKASPVLASNVNLDYILDERLRELCIEEKRMLTLMRTDKLVERATKYNLFYAVNMKPNFNLWAIP